MKQHSACDECRRRKSKCNGNPDGCERCVREGLRCVYSPQRPMGRPRKREVEHESRGTSSADNRNSTGPEDDTPASGSDTAPEGTGALPLTPNLRLAGGANSTSFDPFNAELEMDFSGEQQGLGDMLSHQQNQQQLFQQYPQGQQPNHSTSGQYSTSEYGLQNSVNISASSQECACVSSVMTALQNLPSDNGYFFPISLKPLKLAMQIAQETLNCPQCPRHKSTYKTNFMLVNTILDRIASGFKSLLQSIHAEAAQAHALKQRKSFQMGEQVAETALYHTGGPECPMAWKVDLQPQEWRGLAYRAVQNEVDDIGDGRTTLEALVTATESRQRVWHDHIAHNCSRDVGNQVQRPNEGDMTCFRLIGSIRRTIESFPK
ncbi:MAG: hypothetical protein M1831_005884 [Alyxoria varia]|nr:MAG: hypothetical protein M1831_005884 [Alyxoria varia]